MVLRSLASLLLLVAPACCSNAAGLKFLEENKKKEGVITLPSGLQYKVLRAGDGAFHPTADSSCECHYEGRTAQSYPSGDTFDSSYARGSPTSFAPNQVIKGWCALPAAKLCYLMRRGTACSEPEARSKRTTLTRARLRLTPARFTYLCT